AGCDLGPGDDGPTRGWQPLQRVAIYRRINRRVHSIIVYIADNSDHGQQSQVAIHVSELNRLANRIFIGPVLLNERLAHYGCVRSIWLIARIEGPAAQYWDLHRRKITGAGGTIISVSLPGRVVVKHKRAAWSIA